MLIRFSDYGFFKCAAKHFGKVRNADEKGVAARNAAQCVEQCGGGGDDGFDFTDVADMAIVAAIAAVHVELSACKNGCGMLQILCLYALWLQNWQIRTRAFVNAEI